MRSTALALKDEHDEVPVSSIEVLEVNVAAIRADLNELKMDVRAAVARIDNDIKAAVLKFETEIREMAAKAASDLEKFAARVDSQFADIRQDLREMRTEYKSLRDRTDKNYESLCVKIDATNERIDLTNEKLSNLDRKVTDIGSKLTALFWVLGGLGTFITIAVTIGKALRWF